MSTHEYSRSSIIHHPSSMITLRLSRSYGIRNRFPFEQALSATSRVFTPYVHMYIHTYIHTYIHMCSLVVQWSISYSVYSIQYTVYSVQCSTYCTYSCAAHNVAQSVIRPAPSSFLFLLSLPPFSSSFLRRAARERTKQWGISVASIHRSTMASHQGHLERTFASPTSRYIHTVRTCEVC